MNTIIEEYLRKLLSICYNTSEYDNIVIYSKNKLNDVTNVFLNIKNDYNIDQLVFFDYDYEKLYNFFESNPTNEEIKEYVTRYPKLNDFNKTKFLYIFYDDHSGIYAKLLTKYKNEFNLYNEYNFKINKDYWDLLNNRKCVTGIVLPDIYWTERLFGSKEKISDLWKLINKTISSTSEYIKEIERMKEIKKYLQMSKINNLYFYTNLGTDFRIKLSKHSIWLSEPEMDNGKEFFYNFPSYEIYTSPNCYSAEGKMVISKPSNFYGEQINEAELQFSRGSCIKCDSDNETWNNMIMCKSNNLYRIGEIALVSKDTPIAKLNQTFYSTLLDENAGCHFALGNSIRECINLPEKIFDKNRLRYFAFNKSDYHQDLVIGDNSITVEAEKKKKKKILLLENGNWKL